MASITVPTAALIGAGVSGAAGIASSVIGANAARGAAKTQAAAAELASENQLKEFQQVQANVQPFVDVGKGAIPMVENLLGLGPSGPSGIQSALEATPGYQFTRDQGLLSVQNSYAAEGLGASGAALKGAASYATGLANQTYEQRLADYMGLLTQGANTGVGIGALGLQATQAASGFATSGAAAQAAGTVGAANAAVGGLNALTGGISNASLLLALNNAGVFGSPGGGTSGTSFPWGGTGQNDLSFPLSGTALNPTSGG